MESATYGGRRYERLVRLNCEHYKTGLSAAEARERLARLGRNELPAEKKEAVAPAASA